MKYCKVMNLLVKPLEFRMGVWNSLMIDLRNRGGGYRESGAFLLGRIGEHTKIVHAWLPYDELEPDSLHVDYVTLSSKAFSKLYEECERCGLQVVADVHTHRLKPIQSISDRENPMVSIVGHIAIIVPQFAQKNVFSVDVSVNVYLGEKRWKSFFGRQAAAMIKI